MISKRIRSIEEKNGISGIMIVLLFVLMMPVLRFTIVVNRTLPVQSSLISWYHGKIQMRSFIVYGKSKIHRREALKMSQTGSRATEAVLQSQIYIQKGKETPKVANEFPLLVPWENPNESIHPVHPSQHSPRSSSRDESEKQQNHVQNGTKSTEQKEGEKKDHPGKKKLRCDPVFSVFKKESYDRDP
jgi:hypothetical protein